MKNALRVVFFVIAMGTISGAFLIGVNYVTAPRIAVNEEFKLKSSVLEAFDTPYEARSALPVFKQEVEPFKKGGYDFYRTKDGGIAFLFRGPGLWGPVAGIISLEKDLKTIRKIKILHQEETPGLGGRIAEKEYLEQFRKKEVLPRLLFRPEGKAAQKNEVDAITGATGSSRALEKLLNENIQKYLSALKEP